MSPTGDGRVRLALPGEAPAIAEIQRRVWSEPGHPGREAIRSASIEELTEVWRRAVQAPRLASQRVLVATWRTPESETIVGFVVTSPSDDEDADPHDGAVEELCVDASARGTGHGTRLIQAAVDTLRADGFTRARWWLAATNDPLRSLLTTMGWGPDGAHRTLEDPVSGARIRQVRLHTDIAG